LETLETDKGYQLFSVPFGKKYMEGIGKMGTGDFQPYFAENASVYNHGSQFFYARALAEVGDYEKLYKVLNFAMPCNENNHKEADICAAPYAITNCYQLVPSFRGRICFSFLTGSVAMLERSVYNWLFGVRFTLDGMQIKPCLPKEYKNSEITLEYMGKKVTVKYNGYGSKVVSATVNGKAVIPENGVLKLNESLFVEDMVIILDL
jgi:cellobiose phosphorylase